MANTLATGAALVALILTFGPISGGHFNPPMTVADAWQRGIAWREVPPYISAQIAGAFVGVTTAHLMFGLPLFFAVRHARSGNSQVFSEFVAPFGLLAVILGLRSISIVSRPIRRCCIHYACVLCSLLPPRLRIRP